MKRISVYKPLLVLFAVITGFLFSSGWSYAVEFSADMIIQPKDDEQMTGKFFIKGGNIRQETVVDEEKQILIVRPDKKVSWIITPEEKMYMEIPWQEEDEAVEEWTAAKEKDAKLVGEETVSGYVCKKFERTEDGEKVTYWIPKKMPFPIKVEDPEATIEYKNIKEGAVADSLFEVPSGYEKISMPEPSGIGGAAPKNE
jgi:outer membrane lipoprotein-sorting protein